MIRRVEIACRLVLRLAEKLPGTGTILVAALILRAAFVALFVGLGNFANYAPVSGDSYQVAGVDGYLQIARTLWTSGEYAFEPGGFPVAFRPPVQTVLMLVFGAWWAEGWHWIWLSWSVFASTAVVWLTGKLVSAMGGTEAAGKLAMTLVALHPYQIFSARVPGLVVTLTLAIGLLALCLVRFLRNRPGSAWQLGLAWGLGALTHASLLPLLAPMAVVMFFCQQGAWRLRARRIVAVCLLAGCCVLPWTLRNYQSFGMRIPVSTGGGLQYWLGEYNYFRGYENTSRSFEAIIRDFQDQHRLRLEIVHGGIMDPEQDVMLVQMGMQQIKDEPMVLLRRAMYGSVLFWTTKDKGLRKTAIVAVMNLPLVILFSVLTFLTAVQRRWEAEFAGAWFLLMGIYGLFALVQAIGPYFVVVTPLAIALSSRMVVLIGDTLSGSGEGR
ncbi:MAG: hypothetical protein SNJ84_06790 [Verrucomicrobiia bacterium]